MLSGCSESRLLKHESRYVFDYRSTGTASEVPVMSARAGDEHWYDRLRNEKLGLECLLVSY